MRVVGVDPGLTGALCVLEQSGDVVALKDLPVQRDGKLAWIDGLTLQSILIEYCGGHTCRAVVERVSAMPAQGISSAFQFGVGLGSILAILQASNIPIHLVQPARWKRESGLSRCEPNTPGARKKLCLEKARLRWPGCGLGRSKDDGRAEALLLAAWYINKGCPL